MELHVDQGRSLEGHGVIESFAKILWILDEPALAAEFGELMDADEQALKTRYQETRRRHPMSPGGNVTEGIAAERRMILDYLRTDGHEIHWDLIELGARSNANTFVVPLQDLLGLGSEARMNTPGVAGGNWQWRFAWDQITDGLRDRFAYVTRSTGRAH